MQHCREARPDLAYQILLHRRDFFSDTHNHKAIPDTTKLFQVESVNTTIPNHHTCKWDLIIADCSCRCRNCKEYPDLGKCRKIQWCKRGKVTWQIDSVYSKEAEKLIGKQVPIVLGVGVKPWVGIVQGYGINNKNHMIWTVKDSDENVKRIPYPQIYEAISRFQSITWLPLWCISLNTFNGNLLHHSKSWEWSIL